MSDDAVPGNLVEVRVAVMAVDTNGQPVLLLKPVDEDAHPGVLLPIWIGPMETTAILIASAEQVPSRPLTYDLISRILDACDATVQQVAVTDLVDGTYHAEVSLKTAAGERTVDSRPSDSIALAVRVGAPIFVAADVLAASAIPDGTQDEGETMQQFSEFIQHVDPDDFRN